jgi:ribosomal protein S18 acetylase RimI-like enzyme
MLPAAAALWLTRAMPGEDGGISIERGSTDDIESVRPLWIELHHHHQRVGPQSGPFSDDETSWATRSAHYRDWMAEPGSFMLHARDGEGEGALVGYAMVRVMDQTGERDAWVVPDRVAELETLVVTEGARGSGLGTRLMDRVEEELSGQGIEELFVGLIPGNDGAQRLYESRGFEGRWLILRRDLRG